MIISICFYTYDASVGSLLLSFTSTILVALLTAMAAFDHMNTNEKRKVARENYQDYWALLSSLDERYQNVMTLRDNFKNLFYRDSFSRGLTPPYLIVRDVTSAPDTARLNFLKKCFNGNGEDNLPEMRDSAFNTANIRTLLSNYDYLIALIHERNNTFKEKILNTLNDHYSGDGQTTISAKTLKRAGISYPQLTNFLMLTESLMRLTDELYHGLRKGIDELNDGCKSVLDSEIAKEHYGYPAMKYVFEDDNVFYQPLSESQMAIMSQRDYYSHLDYSQRFF